MFFAMHSDRTISFIGNLEEVQDLIDADDTDPALLAQCPDAPTFSRVFYPVKFSVSTNKHSTPLTWFLLCGDDDDASFSSFLSLLQMQQQPNPHRSLPLSPCLLYTSDAADEL